ncbi:hypothetical protein ACTRXD_04305 [Nitrospira sp. T9]|uniref:hypothetical protein n=2 Tax=unclassified Nitrospira TaxID=2652172 RepID=UPI003F9BC56C
MESSPLSLNMPLKKSAKDPLARLSLAVRELDKLINRANQLAHLSEQALPIDHSTQSDQCTPPQQT